MAMSNSKFKPVSVKKVAAMPKKKFNKINREEMVSYLNILKPVYETSKELSSAIPSLSSIKITPEGIMAFNGTQGIFVKYDIPITKDYVVSGSAFHKILNSYNVKDLVFNVDDEEELITISREGGNKNKAELHLFDTEQFIFNPKEYPIEIFNITKDFVKNLAIATDTLGKDSKMDPFYNVQIVFDKNKKYVIYANCGSKFSKIGKLDTNSEFTIHIPRNLCVLVNNLYKIYGEGKIFIDETSVGFRIGNVFINNTNGSVKYVDYDSIIEKKYIPNIKHKYECVELKEIVDRFVPVFTKESILTVALDSEEKTLSFELEGGDFRMIENLALDKVQEDMNFGIENIRDLKEIIDSCDEISFVKIPTNNSSVSIIAGFGKDYFRMLTTIVEE